MFGKAGYIFVYQDVRGRWMSEGEFVNMRPHNPAKRSRNDIDESTDTYDTIEFLLKHVPNNNGKVGQWGISYPGFYTAAGMIDAHPALKAVVAAGPGHRLVHRRRLAPQRRLVPAAHVQLHGRLRPAAARADQEVRARPSTTRRRTATSSSSSSGRSARPAAATSRAKAAFWDEAMKHGTYDEFWKARNIRQHLKDIKPAVLTVGGWFDAENLFGALEVVQERQEELRQDQQPYW